MQFEIKIKSLKTVCLTKDLTRWFCTLKSYLINYPFIYLGLIKLNIDSRFSLLANI